MIKTLPFLLLSFSLLAQSPQPIASFDLGSSSFFGSYPSSFTAFGDDVYALAYIGSSRSLVKMEQGDPAKIFEVRYNNQTIPAIALERHGDMLFAHLNQGMYVMEAPGAALRFEPFSGLIGKAPNGQIMMEREGMLYRYVQGVGFEEVVRLGEFTTRLSPLFPFGNGLYYLAYEIGGAVELRAVTTTGERSLIKVLGTSQDQYFSIGNALATVSGGQLYFGFTNPLNERQLWRTDGTAEGTQTVFAQTDPNFAPPFIGLVPWNQGVAFSVPGEAKLHLYANGQLETITLDDSYIPVTRLTTLGQNLLFIGKAGIYSKGTTGAPQLIYSGDLRTSEGIPLPVANGKASLITPDGLWSSDGRMAGTSMRSLAGYETEGDPFFYSNSLWASGNRERFYPELLVLPIVGQPKVYELNPQIAEWPTLKPYALGDLLFYRDPQDQTLNMVDGNRKIVLDTQVYEIMAQHEGLIYYSKSLSTGRELWRTDGTSAGTTRVLSASLDGSNLMYVYPSGNVLYYITERNYIESVYRLRADGQSEQIPGVGINYFNLIADGMGGIYLTGNEQGDRRLWHASAADTEFQFLYGLPTAYESEFPQSRLIGGRLWLRLSYSAPDPNTNQVTLVCSDGTAAGTFTYIERARIASLPIDLEGRAGMIVANGDLEGFAISDGSGPLESSDLTLFLAADAALFAGHEFGQLFGTEEDGENQLWRYDLESGEAIYLTTLAAGLRPLQRVEIGEMTLLLLAGMGQLELWQTDGSAEGTQQVGAFNGEAKQGILAGDSFFFTARGPAGDHAQRLYVWSAEHGAELVAATASLSQPEQLTAAGDQLFFLAADQYRYGLYTLGDNVVLPPIQLSAKRLGNRGEVWRINAELIAGASYSWQLQNATAVRPANGPSLLIRASRQLAATVSVVVTLPNGEQRLGTLELANTAQ